MDGNKMKTNDSLFDEFVKVFEFPDYFGHNYDALDECIGDLGWIDFSVGIILVKDSCTLLSKEKSDTLEILNSVFQDASREWSKPIELGEEWDRPAIPFHTVLQSESFSSSFFKDLPSLSLENITLSKN